jgi:hypothetical protein
MSVFLNVPAKIQKVPASGARAFYQCLRVAMTNMTRETRACVQCWRNLEYFILNYHAWKIWARGGGLLHACISSYIRIVYIYLQKQEFYQVLQGKIYLLKFLYYSKNKNDI